MTLYHLRLLTKISQKSTASIFKVKETW